MLKPVREILGDMAERLETTMAEEQGQRADAAPAEVPYDYYRNVLRGHSLEAIQQAIGKALTELTGEKCQARVMRLDFEPKWARPNAASSNSSELVLRVTPPPWHPSADDDSKPVT